LGNIALPSCAFLKQTSQSQVTSGVSAAIGSNGVSAAIGSGKADAPAPGSNPMPPNVPNERSGRRSSFKTFMSAYWST
jgi:hypothetical protein